MKYSKAKIAECAKWVEQNGVYPQRSGAPVSTYCKAMGIRWDTHQVWLTKPEYSEAIKKANEVFAQNTLEQLTNALKKKALGYEYTETSEIAGPRMIPMTDKDGELVINPRTGKPIMTESDELITKKARRATVKVGPDTGALIFMLTNMDGEHWKNRQFSELEGNVNVTKPQIVFGDEDDAETDGE